MASIWVSVTSSEQQWLCRFRSWAGPMLAVWLACLPVSILQAKGVYQTDAAFLDEVFAGNAPEPSVLWLTGALKSEVTSVLHHPYARLRVRYWQRNGKIAWILEEIGKERPITLGFVTAKGQIQQAKVLAFRESRGWEIRHPSFTRQYSGAALAGGRGLDRRIDGITGATLSVRAFTRLAEMALLLDEHVEKTP